MLVCFVILVLAYTLGALSALVMPRGGVGRGLTALCAVTGAAAGCVLGAGVVFAGEPFSLSLPDLAPLGGGLLLRLDPLGAFFLVVIGVGAIPASIYGVGYSAAYEDGRASLRLLGVMLNLFLLSMSLVTMADNVLTFLLMWEGMSLASYFLVITEAGEDGTVQAGLWYTAMTHAGWAALFGAFLILMNGQATGTFADLRMNAATLDPALRNAVFVLALLGFGSKAGAAPLHVWLPRAHPAAPSHVSALMSGVMIKLGVFGLLRVVLDLMGGGPLWWGAVVLAVGAVSTMLGILYALMEQDLKRLLAYSSVENIGIILMAVGTGMIFQRSNLPVLAGLALTGALYHTLNHTAFKTLLFLGAGSVLHATHTRNMEALGGLIKRMPWTAAFFLIGAASIAALPPLNGFASEWLIFQSMLSAFKLPMPELAVLMPIAVGILALTSGLAAAGFVKAFGISFLAIPRSPEAEHAHESPLSMRAGMAIPAVLCVVLGITPFAVLPVLERVLAGLPGIGGSGAVPAPTLFVQSPNAFGQMSPALVGLALLVILALAPLGLRLARANRALRVSDSWGCGRIGQTPRMEYTATAFAEPLRRVFAELYRPTQELSIDFHSESKYFVQSIAYRSGVTPWFEKALYAPLLAAVAWLAAQVRRLQSGSLHLYLAYITIVLIVLLWLARWS